MLKDFRTRHGLTQKEAAAVLGFKDSRSIRNFESGKRELTGCAKKAMEYYDQLAKMGAFKENYNYENQFGSYKTQF